MVDQKIIKLYDEYIEEGLSRREFLEKLGIVVGGTAAALALLALYIAGSELAVLPPLLNPRRKGTAR